MAELACGIVSVLHVLWLRLGLLLTEDAPEVSHIVFLYAVAPVAGGWITEFRELLPYSQPRYSLLQSQALLPSRLDFREHSLVVVPDGRQVAAQQRFTM